MGESQNIKNLFSTLDIHKGWKSLTAAEMQNDLTKPQGKPESPRQTGSPKRRLLIYGDSLLMDVKQIEGFIVHNESTPGLTLVDALAAEEKQIGISLFLSEDDYDVLLICLGTNDLGQGEPAEQVVSSLTRLLETCQKYPSAGEKGPTTTSNANPSKRSMNIYYLDLPFADRKTNQALRRISLSRNPPSCLAFPHLTKAWLQSDQIHLNNKGVRGMELFLAQQLIEKPVSQRKKTAANRERESDKI